MLKTFLSVLAGLGLAVVCVCQTALADTPSTDALTVATVQGDVAGFRHDGIRVWRGMRYGAAPIGTLRWRPPVAPAQWTGVRSAQHFASPCPQGTSFTGIPSTDEDCLFLNVYAPDDSQLHPVMVWIHGGGFVTGAANRFDPTQLVQHGVIVVTLNYRLGALGFMAHPGLSAASGYGGSGNYGLMDQQAALRWVQHNIAAFNGDPNRVTAFGESAGGRSVLALLSSPASRGLFGRAIVQSGVYTHTASLADAEQAGRLFAYRLGCPAQRLRCLRDRSVTDILAAQKGGAGLGFVGNVDHHVLKKRVEDAVASGHILTVPVLIGGNRDEFTFFIARFLTLEPHSPPVNRWTYPLVLARLLSTINSSRWIGSVWHEYPPSSAPSRLSNLARIGTDAVFACPWLTLTGQLAQSTPTYAYEFRDPHPPMTLLPPGGLPYGAAHTTELAYLFDTPDDAKLDRPQQQLADTMRALWTQFSRTGIPSAPGAPPWPAYDATRKAIYGLAPAQITLVHDFSQAHHCAFWQAH